MPHLHVLVDRCVHTGDAILESFETFSDFFAGISASSLIDVLDETVFLNSGTTFSDARYSYKGLTVFYLEPENVTDQAGPIGTWSGGIPSRIFCLEMRHHQQNVSKPIRRNPATIALVAI